MRINTINRNYNFSFCAVKITPSLRNNAKSEAQLLIENKNLTGMMWIFQ